VFVLIAALAAGLVAGYAMGGRLRNIDQLHFRLPWLAIVAFGLQLIAFSPLRGPLQNTGVVILHLVSYGLLVWFVIVNRRRMGVDVAGAGLLLNFAAIALNGGYMPASRHALAVAGEQFSGATANNSTIMHAGTRLWFLGDVFAIPDGSILTSVFSVGDVLIVVGVAILIAVAMRTAPVEVPAAS
jgi:lipoprotein signal peptidase